MCSDVIMHQPSFSTVKAFLPAHQSSLGCSPTNSLNCTSVTNCLTCMPPAFCCLTTTYNAARDAMATIKAAKMLGSLELAPPTICVAV